MTSVSDQDDPPMKGTTTPIISEASPATSEFHQPTLPIPESQNKTEQTDDISIDIDTAVKLFTTINTERIPTPSELNMPFEQVQVQPYAIPASTATHNWTEKHKTPLKPKTTPRTLKFKKLKFQRSINRKEITISTPASPIKSHKEMDRESLVYFQKTSLYKNRSQPVPMHENFLEILSILLDIEVFPNQLKHYLELGQMHQPYLLVNAFGENLKTLTK